MSSTSQKSTPKMCKSPKNTTTVAVAATATAIQTIKPEKVQIINEYENLSTNCTVIGSNNLHLVKKPQVVTSMSPAYSNPSPGYPPSPYSSPASLKSPSPQNFKPPTPQPSFPVMQIIHSSHQLLARPIQTSQPQQNVIKLKPHLNILPKPSASPQPSPKPSVSPHIVIPSQQTATIMPTAQPLLLNQMPMLAPGVQLILRPQTTKIPTHVQTAAPQGLILQPGGQQLLQIQSPRTAQPMVRVLTNGVQLAPQTQVVTQVTSPVITHTTNQQAQLMQNEHNLTFTTNHMLNANSPPKKKPKKKKQKLDLANIMKLSGIGDEDDIQFESDTSQSESEPNTVQLHSDISQTTHHNVIQEANIIRSQANMIHATTDTSKRIGNIQISTVAQPTVSTATPLVQLLNQNFQSGVSSTSFQTSQAAPTGIPLNSFIAPNITINNGLVVQRNGGFKLALGEDGRLVLQHDPTLNQDLQSQLLLQSIFGLNGLVLQPSLDQQVHSQTVQTIQQQSVQTIQQQTVQSQTIQTVQQQTVQPHSLQAIQQTIQPQIQAVQPQTVQQTVQQTIQHQTVQSQPLAALQQHAHSQPMQIVQPQPIHTIQSHNIQQHTIQSQPTVQAIQSQVHQSIQSQIQGQIQSLLQSQPLQTIQPQPLQPVHSQPQPQSHVAPTIQTQQHQPILKVQPFQKTPPVQTVHPQPVQTIHHQPTSQQQNLNENHPPQPPQTSYVVNLTPEQLEQLKRNGQLTVNGQTIFMQRPNVGGGGGGNNNKHSTDGNNQSTNEGKVKLSPKIKPVKNKPNKIQNNSHATAATTTTIIKNMAHDNLGLKQLNHGVTENKVMNHVVKEALPKSSLVSALQAPPKILPTHNQVQVQPQQKQSTQPSAVVQPSVAVPPTVSSQTQTPKPSPTQTKVMQGTQTTTTTQQTDVDHLLGQILEESGSVNVSTSSNVAPQQQQPQQPQQRIHTIQLTPQQQQHLKSIQLQIQTLSARLIPGDTEMHTALKLLFAEQQKILASGKLLPPDKVIYQNNQLTIINPSSLGIGGGSSGGGVTTAGLVKSEPQVLQAPVLPRNNETQPSNTNNNHHQQVMFTSPPPPPPPTSASSKVQVPKITVTIPATVSDHITHTNNVASGPNAIKVPTTSMQQQHHYHNHNHHHHHHQHQHQQTISVTSTHVQQNKFIPSFTKAQLLEQQLNTDQNGAMKPDVYTPFRDKADACKRLIRYHCYNQPVLSEKDLNKADEIFELTARHFIDKFSRMVDKYRFLLLKESMRQVQTSELMMLDRMFLAEEQQSLMRLRQELEEGPPPDLLAQLSSSSTSMPPPSSSSSTTQQHHHHHHHHHHVRPDQPQEEYDEWACIQRELGCLQSSEDAKLQNSTNTTILPPQPPATNNKAVAGPVPVPVSNFQSSPPKRSASSDSRLETLKKFRVDKHNKRHGGGGDAASNLVAVTHHSKVQGIRIAHQQQQQVPSYSLHNATVHCGGGGGGGTSGSVQGMRQQHQVIQRSTVHYAAGSYHHGTNVITATQFAPPPPSHSSASQSHSHEGSPQNVHVLYNASQQQAAATGSVVVPPHHHTNSSGSSVNNNNNNSVNNNNSKSHHGSSLQINNNNNNNINGSESESGGGGGGGANNTNSIDEHVQSAIDSILNLQQNSNLDLDEAVSSILS